ncbi:hypothetical protein SAMN04488527_1645 [Aliiroseovarius crassostreae]|uniref:Uncharacterized protein n=1 Tax=Aliiroseovarius crassostreae TaxID=154981 RepID=A0A0N8IBE9_9RHOB|nr:hypothetical protein [Aliiroseovarius crassostreae]KPN62915.1 hypothetical protein AKJ29_01860 [Aliiroseovarius crassostreae]SFU97962.1 hypothetical protein SAMN04488527_1645 [Aliiroseovarius crassostreae]
MQKFMPFKADPPNGPHEAAFRRGYHHGAVAMIEAMKEGVSVEELEGFVNAELRAWREDHAVPAFPPEPGKSNRV